MEIMHGADGWAGLAVIDISDASNLGIPSYVATTSARDVVIVDHYAYIADESGGLASVNISDPSNLGLATYTEISGDAWGIAMDGAYAYMAATDAGIAIVATNSAISDPSGNNAVLTLPLPGESGSLSYSKDIIVDTTAPEIIVSGGDIQHEQGTEYVDLGATAADNIDGDVTSNIAVSGSIDVNVAGTYTVTYEVSDTVGNSSLATRTVTVSDTTPPVITLLGGTVVSTSPQSPYATNNPVGNGADGSINTPDDVIIKDMYEVRPKLC